MSGRYSHQFCIAYTLESDHPSGDDLTPQDHARAIRERVGNCLDNDEMLEAVGCPNDTYDKHEDNSL